jgi:hypothetical protein
MPLEEEFSLRYLDAKAPLLVNLSQVGSHKKVLIILWGHT